MILSAKQENIPKAAEKSIDHRTPISAISGSILLSSKRLDQIYIAVTNQLDREGKPGGKEKKMAFLQKMNAAALSVGTFLMLGLFCCVVNGSPDTTRRLYQCNPATYEGFEPYRFSVDYLLNRLVTLTANTPGYDLRDQSPSFIVPQAYGHSTCSVSLSPNECAACMLEAYKEINELRNVNIGGKVYLNDCTIRYENYRFTDF